MKRTLVFFGLFVKRLVKKPSFLIILLLMPLLVLAFRLVLKEDSSSVYIGLYSDDKSELITESLKNLDDGEGRMNFYIADSERELREAVLTNDAECGFYIHDGFYDALLNERAENMITIYKNTKTTLDDLTKEMVFAEIFSGAAYYEMLKQAEEKGLFEEQDVVGKEEFKEKTREYYDKYMLDGGIFDVVYSGNGKEKKTDSRTATSGENYLMRPIRGILALFMMIAALAGAVFRAIDEKQGVYKTLGYEERPFINILTVFIPAMLGGIAALICLYIGGIGEKGVKGFLEETVGLFAYTVLLTGFANLLRALIKNEALLCSVLPMLTVVSLLACDIFFNAATMVDGIKELRLVLPPNYLLEKTGSVQGLLFTLAAGLILCFFGVAKDHRQTA